MGSQRVRHDWATFTFTFHTYLMGLMKFQLESEQNILHQVSTRWLVDQSQLPCHRKESYNRASHHRQPWEPCSELAAGVQAVGNATFAEKPRETTKLCWWLSCDRGPQLISLPSSLASDRVLRLCFETIPSSQHVSLLWSPCEVSVAEEVASEAAGCKPHCVTRHSSVSGTSHSENPDGWRGEQRGRPCCRDLDASWWAVRGATEVSDPPGGAPAKPREEPERVFPSFCKWGQS